MDSRGGAQLSFLRQFILFESYISFCVIYNEIITYDAIYEMKYTVKISLSVPSIHFLSEIYPHSDSATPGAQEAKSPFHKNCEGISHSEF